MSNLDAAAVADNAVRLGLITLHQLQEGWDEVGKDETEPVPLLRALERKGHLTPWQSQKLLKDDTDGFFLGGYRLLYKIASGSFGRVFRADDPRNGTVVAIKVLRRKWSEDKNSIDLFEREGKMGMALTHPNLVQIVAVNRDVRSKQYYIVMEFVEGGNLRDFLNIRKKLEPAEMLRVLEGAAAGLAYAFSKGFTHRDLKLTNILISSQGQAKVVDFGLAGIYGPGQGQSQDNVSRTVDYAGLEKATGVAAGDTRSDIFFLGAVAYELLTGRPPMDMSRDHDVRMARERFLNIPALSPTEVKGPPSLFRLLETMMSLKPQERFQTPAQLLEAIRVVRAELEGRASGKPAGPRTIFIVEKNERLQDVLRTKFKERGYRVLLAADPMRALERFRQQPFDLLIVDGATTGDEGVECLDKVLADSERHNAGCAGIAMLTEEQASWANRLSKHQRASVLMHPIKFKQLLAQVVSFVPAPDDK